MRKQGRKRGDGALGQSLRDRWRRWLLERRFSAGQKGRRETMEHLGQVRDRVLDNAGLSEGETLLDVGTGDGVIAFDALHRVGPAGRVVFSDISADCVEHCRGMAESLGVSDRCRFVCAPTDAIPEPDGEMDVVTARSALVNAADKACCLREFHRLLRPGGRLSIFETISPPRATGFDERDLLSFAENAGFPVVRLDLKVLVNTRKEEGPRRLAVAYLWAVK